MLEAFMIQTPFGLYFTDLKQCLPTDVAENLQARKKNSNKNLVQDFRYRNVEL